MPVPAEGPVLFTVTATPLVTPKVSPVTPTDTPKLTSGVRLIAPVVVLLVATVSDNKPDTVTTGTKIPVAVDEMGYDTVTTVEDPGGRVPTGTVTVPPGKLVTRLSVSVFAPRLDTVTVNCPPLPGTALGAVNVETAGSELGRGCATMTPNCAVDVPASVAVVTVLLPVAMASAAPLLANTMASASWPAPAVKFKPPPVMVTGPVELTLAKLAVPAPPVKLTLLLGTVSVMPAGPDVMEAVALAPLPPETLIPPGEEAVTPPMPSMAAWLLKPLPPITLTGFAVLFR